jgi:tetratricopeptide (TPR) repeat protein
MKVGPILVLVVLIILSTSAFGQTTAKDWWQKAFDLSGAGKYNESIEAADESIKLDPDYAPAWNIKSFALFKIGEYNASVEAANKSISLNPTWFKPWVNKANALYKLGKYNESNAALARAKELGYTG